jgi:acyl-CoA-binding protein
MNLNFLTHHHHQHHTSIGHLKNDIILNNNNNNNSSNEHHFNTKITMNKKNEIPVSMLEKQFKAACDAIQNLPKNGPFQPSNELLLKFYAYFKQATIGPCQSSRPSIFKVVERAKYDAW